MTRAINIAGIATRWSWLRWLVILLEALGMRDGCFSGLMQIRNHQEPQEPQSEKSLTENGSDNLEKQCDIQCDIHLLTLLPTDLCVEKTAWIQPLGLPLHSHPQFFFRSWKNEVPLDPGREFGASISCNFDRTR